MKNYILAEYLKTKRSVLFKTAVIIPIVASLIAIGFNQLGGDEAIKYSVETVVNHWVLIWLPVLITLLAGNLNDLEKKSTEYKTTFSLNINLFWKEISRSLLVSVFVLISTVILACILLIVQMAISFSPADTTIASCMIGLLISFVVLIWQIPLWLWLSRKSNTYVCLILNTALSLEIGTRFAMQNQWLFIPWSWGLRLQTFFTRLYSNGLPMPQDVHLTNLFEILLICVFSFFLYLLFLIIGGKSFEKMEVR